MIPTKQKQKNVNTIDMISVFDASNLVLLFRLLFPLEVVRCSAGLCMFLFRVQYQTRLALHVHIPLLHLRVISLFRSARLQQQCLSA